jgi:hypothetical protein
MKLVAGAAASAIRSGVPAWYGLFASTVKVLDPMPIAFEVLEVEL